MPRQLSLEKAVDEVGDLRRMRFEGEMTGVEEVDLGIGNVAATCVRPGGMKNGSWRPQAQGDTLMLDRSRA